MHPHLFALGVEEGRCLSKPHDIVATSGAVAAPGQSASFSVGARMACAAPEPARGQQEESCLKRCLMPPWRGAGRDAALGIDTTVTEATRGGSGAGMSLAKRSAQSFGGNVGVDLRGG